MLDGGLSMVDELTDACEDGRRPTPTQIAQLRVQARSWREKTARMLHDGGGLRDHAAAPAAMSWNSRERLMWPNS
jgi:hypothetical protein